jgi:hypothetical protein
VFGILGVIARLVKLIQNAIRVRILQVKQRVQDRFKWRRIRRRVPPQVVAEVKHLKEATAKARSAYDHEPRLGVVVTSYNQLWNVNSLADGLLNNTRVTEVVVSEDGSIDGSLEAWLERLVGPNHFLIRSNDLHEIRSLDRAIRLCRAEIVCIIQDDDVIPREDWAGVALELFDLHPRMGVLGGFMAYTDAPGFDPSSQEPSLSFISTSTKDSTGFRFVPTVSIGPYYVRANCYQDAGGFDVAYSSPGQAGVGFDEEFGLRAWLRGWQVGYLHQAFKTGIPGQYDFGAGGTALYGGKSERTTHDEANKRMLAATYASHHDLIMAAVRESNERLALTRQR